jgi:hypothetical protein
LGIFRPSTLRHRREGTPAFWEIVDAGAVPEDAELADALDNLGRPDVSGNLSVQQRSRLSE